ncbi:nitric oxide reductase activation protein NorD [Magnetospirillum sp. UT-4]|uniref:nitric oxide reductase activation protein NorD n=1 Tax=Magnetospirillum sp. UT-4 TaxID=2681467 RepID=UPI001386429A|nr:VWA domain-containing protein [Magnetospirillum sp. UT-4]CAA7621459.1 von Willebrand factor type A [Magnetospirillum sp. UT-4]
MALDPASAQARLGCDLDAVAGVLAPALAAAEAVLRPEEVEAWLDTGGRIWRALRDADVLVTFLEATPELARRAGAGMIAAAADTALYLAAVPDLRVHRDFLAVLPAVARRLDDGAAMRTWFRLVTRVANLARPGTAPLLAATPHVLEQVNLEGLAAWVDFGVTGYRDQPWQAAAYFALGTADSNAVLQRQRKGTLLADRDRELRLTLRAFWDLEIDIHPYGASRQPAPHLDKLGLHLPDLLEDAGGVSAIDRYRAMLAHLAAHKLWSRPYIADNFSQWQHLAVELFEDSRVEALAMRRHPGLKRLFLALHPHPKEGAVPEGWSPIRHRLAMISRAILDPEGHGYADPKVLDWAGQFHVRFAADPENPEISTELGRICLAKIRTPDFGSPRIWFEDTIVPYRDDNRYIWRFLESIETADDFHSDHGTEDPVRQDGLFLPVHYPEWDHKAKDYRPDWTTVYQAVQAPGDGTAIDRLLERHAATAKAIRRVIDRLKPQQRRRVRRRPEGDELDFDQVIAALVDLKAGSVPDLKVYQSQIKDGRDIAVLLLLDLSQSINDKMPGSERTLLDVAQEAVSLLAWAVGALGDSFAIAGFASKSRHEVRYVHYKDFAEPWGALPKGRLAAMQAGLATRMGAALRHGGAELAARREEKKLLLLVSDGEPADIDVDDDDYLKADTHVAVTELRAKGIATVCMTLDAKADSYIADVFGPSGFAVVDQVERLPEKLTRLFLSLTK